MPARALMLLIIAFFAALVTSVSLITPVFEASDEIDHFIYIQDLWLNRSLPVLELDDPHYEAYQPPAYYVFSLLVTLPAAADLYQPVRRDLNPFWRGGENTAYTDNNNWWVHTNAEVFPYSGTARAVHVARLSSVVLSLVNAFFVVLLGRALFETEEQVLAYSAVALLIPGYVSVAGVLNNDNGAVVCGTAVLWLCLRVAYDPDRAWHWVGLAVAFSLAVLSKLTSLFLAPAVVMSLLVAYRRSLNRPMLLRNSALLLVIGLACTGWWFQRNIVLYGELTGIGRSRVVWGEGGTLSILQAWISLPWIWESFLGRGGFAMPGYVYAGFIVFFALSFAGWLIRLTWHVSASDRKSAWLIVWLSVTGMAAALLYNAASNTSGAQGRYLYSVMGGIAALVVGGLLAIVPYRFWRMLSYLIAGGMVFLSSVAIWVWLAQAFALPQRMQTFLPPPRFRSLDFQFLDFINLLGYTVPVDRAVPGQPYLVTLYWRATAPMADNYVVFLQLVDDQDNKISQRDTFSGGGMFPTSRWKPGEVVVDTIVLPIDPNAPAPQAFNLIGGLWDLSTGQRLPISSPDPAAQLYKLGEVAVVPEHANAELPPSAHELAVSFASGIKLWGCAAPTADDPALLLFWQSTTSVNTDYKIFVHYWDSEGNFSGGFDHFPAQGRFPTRYWQSGDWIVDKITVPDKDTVSRVDVGFYDADSLQRLAVIEPPQPDGIFSLPADCWKP